jgi:hypothetical protein
MRVKETQPLFEARSSGEQVRERVRERPRTDRQPYFILHAKGATFKGSVCFRERTWVCA